MLSVSRHLPTRSHFISLTAASEASQRITSGDVQRCSRATTFFLDQLMIAYAWAELPLNDDQLSSAGRRAPAQITFDHQVLTIKVPPSDILPSRRRQSPPRGWIWGGTPLGNTGVPFSHTFPLVALSNAPLGAFAQVSICADRTQKIP